MNVSDLFTHLLSKVHVYDFAINKVIRSSSLLWKKGFLLSSLWHILLLDKFNEKVQKWNGCKSQAQHFKQWRIFFVTRDLGLNGFIQKDIRPIPWPTSRLGWIILHLGLRCHIMLCGRLVYRLEKLTLAKKDLKNWSLWFPMFSSSLLIVHCIIFIAHVLLKLL